MTIAANRCHSMRCEVVKSKAAGVLGGWDVDVMWIFNQKARDTTRYNDYMNDTSGSQALRLKGISKDNAHVPVCGKMW